MTQIFHSVNYSWLGAIILYLIVCFASWYQIATLSYGLNSGQLGRHPYLFPFQCFAEDLKCYWFGGQKYRIEFIRSRCEGDGTFASSKGNYSFKDVREKNLYEEVFWAICGGRISFWVEHSTYFLFGWVLIVAFVVVSIVCSVLNVVIFLPIRTLFRGR